MHANFQAKFYALDAQVKRTPLIWDQIQLIENFKKSHPEVYALPEEERKRQVNLFKKVLENEKTNKSLKKDIGYSTKEVDKTIKETGYVLNNLLWTHPFGCVESKKEVMMTPKNIHSFMAAVKTKHLLRAYQL